MLDTQTFTTVIHSTPLVSIDLCLVCDDQLLLGKRRNEPLKEQWFTPGSRILKNESWQRCLSRVALSELGLNVIDVGQFTLMGIWDHFYDNSVIDETISTHYVNLPHYCELKEKPKLIVDDQHYNLVWFDLEEITISNGFSEYMHNYSTWLISRKVKND